MRSGSCCAARNRDGGFGSYEARRSAFGLEWLNPAEMFGDFDDRAFLRRVHRILPRRRSPLPGQFSNGRGSVGGERHSAGRRLARRTQGKDGSWRGVWGVQFIYGTLFGIRGLVAAGAPARRSGAAFSLPLAVGTASGKTGDGASTTAGASPDDTCHNQESQVIQTAWALIALLEAEDTDWTAISRGARFLMDAQDADGTWPRQDMAGVFFRTALLDYVLYRRYFPLHALGLYERRRRDRLVPTADIPVAADTISFSLPGAEVCGPGRRTSA